MMMILMMCAPIYAKIGVSTTNCVKKIYPTKCRNEKNRGRGGCLC